MSYAKLLTKYINNSKTSLRKVAQICRDEGFPIDHSYISKLKNAKMPPPSAKTSRALANALNGNPEELVIQGYIENAPNEVKRILATYANLTNLNIETLRSTQETTCAPLIDNIKADMPLISEQNTIGQVHIPADLLGKVDFAFSIQDSSMIGAGISKNDVVLCKKNRSPQFGQIVVALVNNNETTLKFYIKDKGRNVLRAANPDYDDIELKTEDHIQGHVVKILKDPPPVNVYRDYIYIKEGYLHEWNLAIEEAIGYGIKPDQFRSMMKVQWEIINTMLDKK